MNPRGGLVLAVSLLISFAPAAAATADDWFVSQSGEMRVISNDSAATAAAVLADTARFQAAMQLAAGASSRLPLRVLALGSANSLLEVAPWSLRRSDIRTFGFSQSGPHDAFVALRADRPRDEMIATLRHELVHVMVASQAAEVPAWLDEGLAEFWGSLAIDGDRIIAGRAVDAHVERLRRGKWLPLDKMTRFTRGSVPIGDAPLFYAQSWAMVHFLLLGHGEDNLTGLLPPSTTLPPGFDTAVRQYIADAKWRSVETAWHPPSNQAVAAQPLSESQALAERAALLVFGQRPKGALTLARRALAITANEPLALEVIGTYYFLNNEPERAREWLTRTLATGVPSYTASLYMAVLTAPAADRERYLIEAVRIRPGSEIAWERLGAAFRADGRLEAARRWCSARAGSRLFQWLPLSACGA